MIAPTLLLETSYDLSDQDKRALELLEEGLWRVEGG